MESDKNKQRIIPLRRWPALCSEHPLGLAVLIAASISAIPGSNWVGKVQQPAWDSTGESERFLGTRRGDPDPPGAHNCFRLVRVFIQSLLDGGHYAWFAKIIPAAETLIGVALILGAFVGIAAFFGAFMNWNFMMAGTASINPLMFAITIFLILAWKNAGWWGLDRWLLPAMGTPWRPGKAFVAQSSSTPSGT